MSQVAPRSATEQVLFCASELVRRSDELTAAYLMNGFQIKAASRILGIIGPESDFARIGLHERRRPPDMIFRRH
jgi:hypothetical protein